MNKQLIVKQLVDIGLEEIEANIYLHLLENGPRSHLELSRETNTDRSKIYRYVEKLLKKNLIEESNDAWGKKLQAAKPDNIKLLIEKEEELFKLKKEAVPNLISELSSLPTYAEREFEVRYYRGQEGLRQMLWNQLSAKGEVIAFSYKNRNEMVGKTYAEKIRSEQVERKIVLYEIENEVDQGDFWYTNVANWGNYYKSRHISPKNLKIKQYIAIFNDTVSIANWINNEEIGFEVTNSIYSNMQKQIFWKFWKMLEKNK
ncbi:MAG: helix-turn-helix domain-containing protein [Patescibacteria group bacterium]|jgi:sugar-specific transcriptional regulator TrmB